MPQENRKMLMVRLRAPTGEEMDVPANKAGHFKKLGAQIISSDESKLNFPAFSPMGQQIGNINVGDLLHVPTLLGAGLGGVAGGIAGGMVGAGGGPAGVGIGTYLGGGVGAGIGAAPGRMAENALRKAVGIGAPEGSDAVQDVAKEAAWQSLNELTGRGIAAGAKAGTKAVVNAWIPQEIRNSFKGVADTIIKRHLPAGQLAGRGGYQAANVLEEQSVAKLNNLLASAKAAGNEITLSKLSRPYIAELEKEHGRALTRDEFLKAISQLRFKIQELRSSAVNNVVSIKASNVFDPVVGNRVKQLAAKAAENEGVYKDALRGVKHDEISQVGNVARGMQASLEEMPGYGVQIKAQNAETQSLMGASRALRAMGQHGRPTIPPPSVGMPRPTDPSRPAWAVPLWYLMRTLFSPEMTTRAAIAADNPLSQLLMQQGPRMMSAHQDSR